MKKLLLLILLTSLNCVGYDAQRYDSENACWMRAESIEPEFGISRSCGGSTTFSEKDGEWWRFGSTCLPSDYKIEHPPKEIALSPECEN